MFRGDSMEKITHTGGKIFFTILIISIISYLYFTILPLNDISIYIGYIFSIVYFWINFYTGFRTNLNLKESILVGIIGSGMGLFLLFFALYTEIVGQNSEVALWIIKPYFIPTMSLVQSIFNHITIIYPIILIIINICLVVIGSITRKIMHKI